MDIDRLQAALDECRATGNARALEVALGAEGWRRRRTPVKYASPQDEIRANVEEDPESGCWVWTGRIRKGYGQLGNQRAHRVSYEAFIGPIPEGLVIDHLCRNRACVRPDPNHLEPVTPAENDRRARAYVQKYPGESVHHGAKRWCIRGHAFDEQNTGIDGKGKRYCKACRYVYVLRHRERQKAAGIKRVA